MSRIVFEWDEGNKHKSVLKHGISNEEAESIFMDKNKILVLDNKHTKAEIRYICIGKSYVNRVLFCSYTIRNHKIRIISTRIADKKIKNEYLSIRS